jgi:hypothetical protein
MTTIGLIAIAAGSLILSLIPATLGIPSYITPIVVITVGYALFQTANNTAVMAFRTPPRFALRRMARLSFPARIEGAHSDRAASASKKDSLAAPPIFLRLPATSLGMGAK